MQSLSKYNKGIKYLLCAIDLFRKYAWVIPLKDKRGISIVNAFQKIISQGRKPNKIWVDKSSKSTIILLTLDNIVNKNNNTVDRKTKMKPIGVTSDTYAEYNEDSNKKDPKFKDGDHVRI